MERMVRTSPRPPCTGANIACFLLIPAAAWGADARALVVRALHADEATARIASKYTYQESEVTKEMDADGHLRKTTTEVHDILFLGGKRYEHLLEKGGKPLPARDAAREEARLDKAAAEASRLSAAEKEARFGEFEKERARQREFLKSIPDAFAFTLLGQPVLDGHPSYLVKAAPRPEYRGKYGNILRSIEAKMWINQSDDQWVRIEATVLDDVSFGFFLGKLQKGARLVLERTRVNQEVWLPKYVQVKFAGRALLKRADVEQTVVYRNYRRYSTDSRIVSVDENKP